MFNSEFWDVWMRYFNQLIAPAILVTLRLVAVTMLICVVCGFGLACLMVLTHPSKGLHPNKKIYTPISVVANSIRSFPFVLLIVTLAPITRFILGTMIGEAAAILPLSVGGIPFVARLLENAMMEVNPQLIEMARSFGLSNREILVRVILKESVPAIVNSVTLATINCVGSTAMAGAVGAGGLGSVALNYGFYSFNDLVLYTSVIITLIIVQLIQLAGSLLYHRCLRK